MSDKSNTVAIGAFVIGAGLIVISALIFMSSSGWGGDKSRVVMVFDGSVKGLAVGAPITLRGVKIGQITDIRLVFDTQKIDVTAVVEAEIDHQKFESRGGRTGAFAKEMLAKGLRAQLDSQSLLTGLLYVRLAFYPDTKTRLADIDSSYSQIPTIPTDLQRITQELESMDFAGIAQDIRTLADGLGRVVSTESFQQLPVDLHTTLSSITDMTTQLKIQINSSGPKFNNVLDDTAKTIETLGSEIPKISTTAVATLKVLDKAITAFDATMLNIKDLVSDDSATVYGLKKALREVALAGRELQLLAKTLEEHPEALIKGLSKDSE